jgi:hypothetical protein
MMIMIIIFIILIIHDAIHFPKSTHHHLDGAKQSMLIV